LVNHWSPLTHTSHCMTTSRPAAATQMRVRVSTTLQPEVFFTQDGIPATTVRISGLRHWLRICSLAYQRNDYQIKNCCKIQKTSHCAHCRVLPPAEFNGIITDNRESFVTRAVIKPTDRQTNNMGTKATQNSTSHTDTAERQRYIVNVLHHVQLTQTRRRKKDRVQLTQTRHRKQDQAKCCPSMYTS